MFISIQWHKDDEGFDMYYRKYLKDYQSASHNYIRMV